MYMFVVFSKYSYNGKNIYRKKYIYWFYFISIWERYFFVLYNMSFDFSICTNLKNDIFFKNKYIYIFEKK